MKHELILKFLEGLYFNLRPRRKYFEITHLCYEWYKILSNSFAPEAYP